MPARLAPLALALAAGLATACATVPNAIDAGATSRVAPGDSVTLQPGQSATVTGATPLVVTVREVRDDSRCPVGVQCVWAGDVAVALHLVRQDAAADTVVHLEREPRQVAYGGYTVRLASVAPEARAGETIAPDDYRITLAVGRP